MAIKNAAPVRHDPSLYTKCADRDGERASRATIYPRRCSHQAAFTSQDESRAIGSARSHEVSIVSVPVNTIRIHRLLVGRNLTARRSPLLHQTAKFAERVEQLFRIQ